MRDLVFKHKVAFAFKIIYVIQIVMITIKFWIYNHTFFHQSNKLASQLKKVLDHSSANVYLALFKKKKNSSGKLTKKRKESRQVTLPYYVTDVTC